MLTSSSTTVGRASGNSIVLSETQVSGRHAQIVMQQGGYVASDLGSSNGTWINGRQISTPASLANGDYIAFGSEKFTFQVGGYGTAVMSSFPANQQSFSSASPASSGRPISTGGIFGAKVVGSVTNVQPQQQETPPPDPARIMVMAGLTIGFIGLFLNFIFVAIAVGIALLICGGAALIFVLPMLFMPLQMIYSGIMSWLKDDKPVMAVRFSLDDEITRIPTDVLLYLKPGAAGLPALGDRVMVWGIRQGAAIRASKVRIIERSGQATNINIAAKQPWPIWVGFLFLAGIAASLLFLAISLGLIQL